MSFEEALRHNATHWSKDPLGGTAGYLLTEEQFQAILKAHQKEVEAARVEARLSEAKIWKSELDHLRRFQEAVVLREQLKIGPIRLCAKCSDQLTALQSSKEEK